MKWDAPYVWGWVAVLVVLLSYELWALLDHNTHTPSLTSTTVRYVPWFVTLSFIAWLFIHFAVRYANTAYIEKLRGGK